jgi:hypothetical protein
MSVEKEIQDIGKTLLESMFGQKLNENNSPFNYDFLTEKSKAAGQENGGLSLPPK